MLTPEQKVAFLEITRLAMEIPNSKMSFDQSAECIYVYDFVDIHSDSPEYLYCFKCHAIGNTTEKLDKLIESLTSYIKENGITA